MKSPCVQCLKCNPIESFQGHLIYDGGHMVAHPHDLKVCPSCQAVLVSWAMVGPSPSTRGRSYPSSHHTAAGRAKTAGHEETPAATIAHFKVITSLLAHRSIKTSFHKFHTFTCIRCIPRLKTSKSFKRGPRNGSFGTRTNWCVLNKELCTCD